MSRFRKHGVEMVQLTAADLVRFRRCAPAALARRSGGFVGATLARSCEQLLIGGVPIIGMLSFGWSAEQLLAFLLVGLWVGIATDIVKLWTLAPQVQRYGQARFDDWHVWVVVGALRAGRWEAPKANLLGEYKPWVGVFVDLTAGAVGSAMIILAVVTEGSGSDLSVLAGRGFAYGLAGVVGFQIAALAWEIARHTRGGGSQGEVRVAPGMRGLILFLLTFVVVLIREHGGGDGQVARGAMLVVNGLIVAAAIFNAVGLSWLRGETRWLRQYLKDGRNAGANK